MRNRNELKDARRRFEVAARELADVEELPRRKGSRVQWDNGVVWTRAGDDDWRPDTDPATRYSSVHVGGFPWAPVR